MSIIVGRTNNKLKLDSDIDLSLSFFVSGCFFYEYEEKIIFIIKDLRSKIKSLENINRINFRFKSIARQEFPSISAEIMIKNSKDLSTKYDYFFNTESEEEMKLLNTLKNKKLLDLYFFDESIKHSISLKLIEVEVNQLSQSINEVF